jgi:16S rRNA (guanine527-N7)-methyltransferase
MSAARSRPQPSLADRNAALALVHVSRETGDRLDRFVATLLRWQDKANLIAPSTIPHLWTRHVADSLQLLDLVPAAKTWIDLGSGGGFPGLPIACALADTEGAIVHLVESNAKKAAFLREAVRTTKVPATVHAERIENVLHNFAAPVDVVMARALAPLKVLFDQCPTMIQHGTVGLFPKGQDVEAELTAAAKYWNINHTLVPSRTDPNGRIVVVHGLERR